MIYNFSRNLTKLLHVVGLAQGDVNNLRGIEPEHVLLEIIEKKFGTAYIILTQLNLNIPLLHDNLKRSVKENSEPVAKPNSHLPLSLRLQRALTIAENKSIELKSNFVGTDHLLFAFTVEDICPPLIQFLRDSGKTRSMLDSCLKKAPMSPPTERRSRQREVSILTEFGLDLNKKQKENLLDPTIGREKEMQRIIAILCRRTKNNPILVGEAGVGKTAIVEGLAALINNNAVPRMLANKRIVSIEIGSLLAGTKYRGQFEERIKRIVDESIADKNIILFIDEVHTLLGAGTSGQNSLDAADLLKPALARGEIQCIGATTQDEYRRYIEKDSALERRFQPIAVDEPTIPETIDILNGVKSKYEVFHNVKYTDQAITKAVQLSARYVNDRFLPDKAIDIIDEAGATLKISLDKKPEDLCLLENEIENLTQKKDKYVKTQNYEEAAKLRDEVKQTKEHLEILKKRWENPMYAPMGIVDEAQIEKTISSVTKIPLQQLTDDEANKLLSMTTTLQAQVIGQDNAINIISHAIQRSRAGVASSNRPIGAFLFLGPTGVGKTLLAKKIAAFLFGRESALIRIDMSDFMEKHNVARLVGAPPGYVGFENGGLLTEQVRKNQYSVILFDEIEKAHKDVFNILLQVLEEGELQDNLGHTVNFKNTVIIMTSNAGSRSIINENRLGFNVLDKGLMDYAEIKQNAEEEIKNFLSPEFINRLDDIVVFEPLNEESVGKILELQLNELNQRLTEKHITVACTAKAKKYFIKKGYDPSFGARPMRRLVQTEIENELAEKFLRHEIAAGALVTVDINNDKVVMTAGSQNEIQYKTSEVTVVGNRS